MDSSVSPKDEIWFLRVCHHISNAAYLNVWVCNACGMRNPRGENRRIRRKNCPNATFSIKNTCVRTVTINGTQNLCLSSHGHAASPPRSNGLQSGNWDLWLRRTAVCLYITMLVPLGHALLNMAQIADWWWKYSSTHTHTPLALEWLWSRPRPFRSSPGK